MRSLFRLVVAFVVLLLVTGASTPGILPQDADLDAAPLLRLVEELRIGSATDPNVGFTGIGGVDVGRDGQIYVYETRDMQIRVYSSTGQLVRTIGRRGGGPGEFQSTPSIGVKGDTVWTRELSNSEAEITLFSRTGSVLLTSRSAGVEVPARGASTYLLLPQILRSDGNFVSGAPLIRTVRGRPPTGLGDADSIRFPRVLFDIRGIPVDTTMWEVEAPLPPRPATQFVTIAGGQQKRVPLPYSDANIVARFGDGRYVVSRPTPASAAAAVMRVTRSGLRNESVFSRGYRYRPVGYSPALLDTIAAQSIRSAPTIIVDGVIQPAAPVPDVVPFIGPMRQAMRFPQFQPPVLSVFLGADAAIWLRREEAVSPTNRWVLLDTRGNPRGRFVLPVRLRLVWSSGDVVFGVLPDADDVPWLVKYRIE